MFSLHFRNRSENITNLSQNKDAHNLFFTQAVPIVSGRFWAEMGQPAGAQGPGRHSHHHEETAQPWQASLTATRHQVAVNVGKLLF